MPRDLPLGNGSLLAAYDSRYQIRDLYWPHVGQENHAMGTARTKEDLQRSLDLIHWVVDHALPSGVLAEQVNPFTDEPLSVSPLTWSHAAFVATVQTYLDAQARLQKPGSL